MYFYKEMDEESYVESSDYYYCELMVPSEITCIYDLKFRSFWPLNEQTYLPGVKISSSLGLNLQKFVRHSDETFRSSFVTRIKPSYD